MNARFFKKFSPSTEVLLGNGASIKFNSLDTLVGFFATNDAYVASEFDRFIREQRYGLSEITWDQYNEEYVQKKSGSQTPSSHVWREELTHRGLQSQNPLDKLRALGGNVAAVKSDISTPPALQPVTVADVPNAPSVVTPPPVPTTPPKPFTPPVGKRKKNATI